MPIIVGNKPIFRVKIGNVNIREIKKGNDLEGGLYEITYINKGPKNVSIGYDNNKNIPEYVGGYPDYSKSISDGTIVPNDFYLYVPDDATAEESGQALGSSYAYKSHPLYGYDDPSCDSLYYIPAVTKDFYRDLSLYCKGKQRRYLYNGVGQGDTTDSIIVDGIGVPDP